MILVFIGFNLDIKIDAWPNTSKANPPAIFHGLIPRMAFNKSTSFLRNITSKKRLRLRLKAKI